MNFKLMLVGLIVLLSSCSEPIRGYMIFNKKKEFVTFCESAYITPSGIRGANCYSGDDPIDLKLHNAIVLREGYAYYTSNYQPVVHGQ